MRKGTTPTHQFVLPFSVEMIDDVEITYCQNKREVLKRYKRHCTLDGKSVSVRLSQEDTFEFAEGIVVEIQLRVLTTDGSALASDIITVSCQRCLSDEVL